MIAGLTGEITSRQSRVNGLWLKDHGNRGPSIAIAHGLHGRTGRDDDGLLGHGGYGNDTFVTLVVVGHRAVSRGLVSSRVLGMPELD